MKKRVKYKTFWILHNSTKGWYLCCLKHCCHKFQCISKYLLLHLLFSKGIKQFNYCNKASNESNQRYSVFGSNHWQHIAIPCFCQNLWKILVKEFIFDNAAGYRSAVLLQRELFLWHFSRILSIGSVGKIIEQLFWRKPF